MNNARPLRIALLSNAVFSATNAGLMLVMSATVGTMLGIQAPIPFQILGIALAIFAVDLVFQATLTQIATWRGALCQHCRHSLGIGDCYITRYLSKYPIQFWQFFSYCNRDRRRQLWCLAALGHCLYLQN